MRSPNKEQMIGIEHTGNFLLQAGAGSGKTFVLIEHVVYKIKIFILKNKNIEEKEFKEKLQRFLSSIVIMTFTKKAVNEIIERVKSVFILMCDQEGEHSNDWNLVKKNINYIRVTTIHGFCFKIISRPYFTVIPSKVEILSNISSQRKIEKLFNDWFMLTEERGGDFSRGIYNSIIVNFESIVKSLCSVFNSPELRLLWEQEENDSFTDEALKNYFSILFKTNDIGELFESKSVLSGQDEHSNKKWFEYLSGFERLALKGFPVDLKDIDDIADFFKVYNRHISPHKNLGLHNIKIKMDKIKILKEMVKEHYESWSNFFKADKSGPFYEWKNIIYNIFNYINKNYHRYSGYTYSDLEYYCFKGLSESNAIREKIREEFKYFVIDEFQDTSRVQFDVLKSILNNNFENLFCVGDIKQAIYGFRGGELDVFNECQSLMKKNHNLLNNYRSHPTVINFNNSLFSHILAGGHKTNWKNQMAPNQKEGGVVGKIAVNMIGRQIENSKRKFNSSELDYFESLVILEKIIELKKENPAQDICVLYRKLGASRSLLGLLLENKIGFTSQVKIPYQEDPLFGIFQILIECYLERKTILKDGGTLEIHKEYCCIILDCYLNYLGVEGELDITKIILKFFNDVKYYGVFEAFKRAIFDLKLSGFRREKIDLINEICNSSNDDCDLIWKELTRNGDKKQSFEFKNGKDPEKIILMTSHSSKGLEFDSVILGGIHTNGGVISDHGFIGKLPGSYKWKESSRQKDSFKSPNFILEGYLQKKRNIEEDKRLFYVSCTRAKKNLYWVDLEFSGRQLPTGKKVNWINYFRNWENEALNKKSECEFKLTTYFKNLNIEDKKICNFSKVEMPPFYQLNPLGLRGRSVIGDERVQRDEIPLGVLSEISVTKLSLIVSCPRKYYLENVCKLNEEEMEIIDTLEDISNDKSDRYFDVSDIEGDVKKSSKERGIEIHSKIERFFMLDEYSQQFHLEKYPYILKGINIIKGFSNDYNFLFEHSIKFTLFGFMISGRPDLLLMPKIKGKIFRILDLKTGMKSPINEELYFFQLLAYGYASYQLGHLDKKSKINLSLLYVDTGELEEQVVSYSKIVDKLSFYFKKISSLDETNLDHCPICQYKNICQSEVARID